MSKLTFQQGNGTERVTLDGEELTCVTSIMIKAKPGEPAEVELGLVAIEVESEVPGQENEIRVTKDTTDLLVRYGWTPPEGHVACKTYTTEELLAEQGREI